MNKTLIAELKNIVGNKGQLIELDFRHWPSRIFVAYKQKTLEYGWDTMWRYTDKNADELDLPVIDYIKQTFQPLGNIMFCTTSFSQPSDNDDYVIKELPYGDKKLTATSKNGKFYMSVKPSTLREIKRIAETENENSMFVLINN